MPTTTTRSSVALAGGASAGATFRREGRESA
jgi:hypothetical protein